MLFTRMDIMVDIVFMCDIFITFCTSYIDEERNFLVKDPKRIAIHYIKTWFLLDLISAMPFEEIHKIIETIRGIKK